MADLVLIAVLAAEMLLGWRKGTIRVLAGLGSWVIAYQAARYYSGFFAAYFTGLLPQLDPGAANEQMISFISLFIDTNAIANRFLQTLMFVIIFVVVKWLVRRAALLLTSLVNFGVLGLINRAVGAFLAGVLTIVIILVLHSVALPFLVNMKLDFAIAAQEFLNQSQLIMPLVYALPQLVSGVGGWPHDA